jgi:hypothetical protein
MNTAQVMMHYTDGRPSETRDMTDEEIAELDAEGLTLDNTNETPSAIDSEQ